MVAGLSGDPGVPVIWEQGREKDQGSAPSLPLRMVDLIVLATVKIKKFVKVKLNKFVKFATTFNICVNCFYNFSLILSLTRITLVNGTWGEWGAWTSCNSRTGAQKISRECNKLSQGGSACSGNSQKEISCKGIFQHHNSTFPNFRVHQ